MLKKELIVLMMIFIMLFQLITPLLSCYAMETDVVGNNDIQELPEEVAESDTKVSEVHQEDASMEETEILDSESDSNNTEENIILEDKTNNNIEMEDIDNQDSKTNDNVETKDVDNKETEEITRQEHGEETTVEEELENLEDDEILEDTAIDNETNENIEIIENSENDIMAMSGDIFVGNEAEFRNALANHADNIRVRQSIDFTAPVYINYAVKIVDESDDNALRYGANGASFIIVQNGGSLILDGMVVDTNSSGATGMTAINIEAGGSVTFINSSIVDGGLGNTGILVNDGANLLLWSSKFVRCNYGINLQANGNLGFATQEGRVNEFYWNKTAVLIDNFHGNCDFSQNICMHDNTEHAIYVANSSGNVNIMAGDYYNNSYCVRTANGTATVSGGSFHNNGWAIWCGGNLNLTGGDIYGNYYGVLTDEAYNGSFTMTGGSIHDNTAHAIQHQKENNGGCTILGGTILGDIYLEKNDNYVNTNSNYPSFTVTPSTYYFKRKLVRTTDNNTANSEINNVTLTPKDNWYKYVDNEYIVLWQNCQIAVRCMDYDAVNGNIKINGNVYNEPVYLKDTKFNVLDETGNVIETLTTDRNGYAISKALPAAKTYKVKQVSTLPNYIIDNKEETVNFTDATYTVEFVNEHTKGNLAINKIDKDDNSKVLEGVTFDVYVENVDSPYKKEDIVGSYTTDEDGKINAKIWTGDYYLVERETLDIYNLNTETTNFAITDNKDTELTIENEKKKDRIEINVKDEDTDLPLEDITFDILDEDGNVVDTITTDEDGHAISKELPIDEEYTVIQTSKKDNYIPNDEKIKVNFIEEFGYEDDQIFPIDITNKHKERDILLKKVDYDDNDVTLEGFEFELYVENVDEPYKKDQLIGKYTTNENGEIYIEKIWTGDYYLKEVQTETSKYYRLLEDKVEVTVSEDNTTELTVTNEKQKGKIEINKKTSATDSEITGKQAGSPLDNAVFGIYDEDGNEVDRITTDENGYAISKGLPIDKKTYTIKEISAPEWYLVDTNTERRVEFNKDGEVIGLEWTDEAIIASLDVEQTGIVETQAGDMIRYDITSLKNKSNVELDNFTLENHLPYEYTSLKSLYTGTYNYDRNYTVWYKINNQDEWLQMVNENSEDGTYNTLKNNYVDFSSITETITDYKINFGTVESDFSAKEDDMPFIFVKVNDDVKNNDTWTNEVKLLGTYISNHDNVLNLEDTSEVKTTVYSHELDVKDRGTRTILPKTGC